MMFLDIAENSAAMKRAKKEAYFQVSCLYSYNDTSRMNPTSDFFFLPILFINLSCYIRIYFQYVYHTVGIEGNTMSLAQTRSILETKLAVGGKSIMEHNEILGMDAALKYLNQVQMRRT